MADLLPWWNAIFGYLFDVVPKREDRSEDNTYSLRDLLSKYKGESIACLR